MNTFNRPYIHPGLLTGFLSLVAAGCMTTLTLDRDPAYRQLLDKDVKSVDPIVLEALSLTEPISIDDAAKQDEDQWRLGETDEEIPINLAEARASALANNLDLKVQLYQPSLEQETLNAERAKFEAAFYGSIRHTELDSPSASQLQGTQAELTDIELGIVQPLPTGGELSLALPINRQETNNSFNLLNPSVESDLRVSISQPLLRGAGIQSNAYTIRVAEVEQKAAETQTKLEAIRVLTQAERAYWLVYGASEALSVRTQQYELAERQLREARLRVNAGAAAPVEITRAESGLASRLEGILIARTNLRLARRELARIINRNDRPMRNSPAFVPATMPNPVRLTLDPTQLSSFAVQNRMELLELELRLALDERTIDFQRNARLKLFLVDYTYNVNGLGGNAGRAFDSLGEFEHDDWSIGARAEIPIGNAAANARLGRAVLARAQRLATREQREQTIRQETLNAIDLLEQNWQRILAARQEAIFADRTYRAERRQFELGVRTSTDVLDAAERLALAQLREVNALVDYQIAQVDIAFAVGAVLGQSQIEWVARS